MIRLGLERARALGHKAVILVGDAPYYERFGFSRAGAEKLDLPGPVELARFLALELESGALAGAEGMVRATGAAIESEGDRRLAA
jgi:predicted N-acetyltransferase YhbS